MKKILGLFLILLFSSLVFGQTTTASKLQTPSEDENSHTVIDCAFPLEPNELERRVNLFYSELANQPTARGIIINHGTDKVVSRCISRIKRHIRLKRFDLRRAEFIRGSNETEIRTRFFIVKEGDELPKP